MDLFAKLSAADVITDPFPYVVMRNALPDEEFCRLREEAKYFSRLISEEPVPARKVYYHSNQIAADPHVGQAWKRASLRHLQPDCLSRLLQAFAPQIRLRYPELEQNYGPLESWTYGERATGTVGDTTLMVDAQMIAHAPVPGPPTEERGPHVKKSDTLLMMHYFLRAADDDCPGGDLHLYRCKPGTRPVVGHEQQILNLDDIESVRCIPYEPNLAFVLLNTAGTITSISARGYCGHPIMIFNVTVALPEPVFKLAHFPAKPNRAVSLEANPRGRCSALMGADSLELK